MAGRPSKYNPERVQKIYNALSAGNTRRDSCAYAGISEAEADAAVRNVSIIAKAAQEGTWQAAAWWLERRRKQDWALRHEFTGPDAGPLKIIVEYTKQSI